MSEEQTQQGRAIKRHPLANYFLKPTLQIRFTIFFILVILVGTLGSTGIILLLNELQWDGMETFKTAAFILATYSGALWIIAVTTTVVGVFVGMYASRKVALPIYKVEQWASGLKEGNLTRPLGMRGSDYWADMAQYCNGFLKDLKGNFSKIEELAEAADEPLKSNLKKILSEYQFK